MCLSTRTQAATKLVILLPCYIVHGHTGNGRFSPSVSALAHGVAASLGLMEDDALTGDAYASHAYFLVASPHNE